MLSENCAGKWWSCCPWLNSPSEIEPAFFVGSGRSIPAKPEELLRAGDGIGVRTRRSGNVAEGAGESGRGLQIKSGVGPAQHQLIVQKLKIKERGRNA